MSAQDLFADVGPCPSTGIPIRLCYNVFGEHSKPCVLLIMGLGLPGIAYDNRFCTNLAARGFYVVRFDNRDVGKSTILEKAPRPKLAQLLAFLIGGTRVDLNSIASYTIADMAVDTYRLLHDHLKIARAHVVGMCLGGMVAQFLLLSHPECVASICLIGTQSGGATSTWPTLSTKLLLTKIAARPTNDAAIAQSLAMVIEGVSGDYKVDRAACIKQCRRFVARGIHKEGIIRQGAAMITAPSCRPDLIKMQSQIPVVIIHGAKDYLVPVENANALSVSFSNCVVVKIPGLGHSLHPSIQPYIIDVITRNMTREQSDAARAKAESTVAQSHI